MVIRSSIGFSARFAAAFLASAAIAPALAEEPASPASADSVEDLYALPVEQLARLDYIVTSASKKEEKVLDTASAIYVVTQEDIRRSGATSIPEVLRMVPGVNVARIENSRWAISVRGFNGKFGNKLLVLIDGRSVYTPFFSGVYWDQQDTVLEDIERIEVIRGPGATLWGANAVNGVINIITKHAKETQGNLVTAGGGNIERSFGAVRHGGKAGDVHYRVYAKRFDHRDSQIRSGVRGNYDWEAVRAGFRTDWENTSADTYTVQGDIYTSSLNSLETQRSFTAPLSQTVSSETKPQGGNLLGRWNHDFSPVSELQLQAYFDQDVRVDDSFSIRSTTFDIEIQHSYGGFEDHFVIWGAGARRIKNHVTVDPFISADPATRTMHVFNAFLQDEITLNPAWTVTLGSKFEHNVFTGLEIQPSVRTLWKADEHQSLWAGVSRAVRTPNRTEEDFNLTTVILPAGTFGPFSPITKLALLGTAGLKSEEVITYEAGYRAELNKRANIDVTVFYNDYKNLIGTESGASFTETTPVSHTVRPLYFRNNAHGETYGLEIAPAWNVTEDWMLKGSYSLLKMALHRNPGSTSTTSEDPEGESPQQQFSLISYLSLPHDLELDAMAHYIDSLPQFGLKHYVRMDIRLGWEPMDGLELSLVGQNLFREAHYEIETNNHRISIPRSVYTKATWRF